MDKTIEFMHILGKKKKTPEEKHKKVMEYTKGIFEGKEVELKKIDPEKSWGKEHCEYCFSDLIEGDYAYSDSEEKYWLCKKCYNKHKEELKLKT